MIIKNVPTWINYLEQSERKDFTPEKLMMDEVDRLINLHNHTSDLLSHSVPVIYLLDYTTGKYLMVSKHCKSVLGFSVDDVLNEGIELLLEGWHPDDFRLFNQQIFKDIRQILKKIPVEQHKDYIFSFNYRFKNGKGEYINLLQRSSFLKSDKNGNPLISLGILTNVNHFTEYNPVVQLVEKINSITGDVDFISKNTYYLHEEDKIFTRREREILLHVAQGSTSKEIADKLFISEHTVINHKRNMHSKSNTQNAASLISFAFRQHLL